MILQNGYQVLLNSQSSVPTQVHISVCKQVSDILTTDYLSFLMCFLPVWNVTSVIIQKL